MDGDLDIKSTESIINKSGLTSSQVSAMNKHYKKAVSADVAGAAGWHGPSDIQTLAGLEGDFLWMEDPFNVKSINFQFNRGEVGSQGVYKLSEEQNVIEEGDFSSVPNNPAVGSAFINLMPNENQTTRSFIVEAMMTDDEWKIIIMLLDKLGSKGPILLPFPAIRKQ